MQPVVKNSDTCDYCRGRDDIPHLPKISIILVFIGLTSGNNYPVLKLKTLQKEKNELFLDSDNTQKGDTQIWTIHKRVTPRFGQCTEGDTQIWTMHRRITSRFGQTIKRDIQF